MRVLIIEDEAPAFRRLQRVLEEIDASIVIIDVLDSVEESVKWLRNHESPDLIFMDIQLADGISFDIFQQIDITAPVIFTTAYDEYTLKAFKVNSIDYLLKPIKKELLEASLQKWSKLKAAYGQVDISKVLQSIQPEAKNYKSRFLVKSRDQLLSIKATDIAYFYTEDGLVYLRTQKDNRYVMDQPLDVLEQLLDPSLFYRLNRQFLVHLDAIVAAHAYDKGKILVEIKPKAIQPVLVSRDKASDFKRWLDAY